MRKRFGVSGKALGWVEQYMRDRSQAVRVNSNESASAVIVIVIIVIIKFL